MCPRFWKSQCFPSPWVNQSGYENHSDDFCAVQERPIPVPHFSFPSPAAGFAWVASLQQVKFIEIGEETGFLELELELLQQSLINPEQNKLISIRLAQADVRGFNFCGENENSKPLVEAWAMDA